MKTAFSAIGDIMLPYTTYFLTVAVTILTPVYLGGCRTSHSSLASQATKPSSNHSVTFGQSILNDYQRRLGLTDTTAASLDELTVTHTYQYSNPSRLRIPVQILVPHTVKRCDLTFEHFVPGRWYGWTLARTVSTPGIDLSKVAPAEREYFISHLRMEDEPLLNHECRPKSLEQILSAEDVASRSLQGRLVGVSTASEVPIKIVKRSVDFRSSVALIPIEIEDNVSVSQTIADCISAQNVELTRVLEAIRYSGSPIRLRLTLVSPTIQMPADGFTAGFSGTVLRDVHFEFNGKCTTAGADNLRKQLQ